mmetsp:Transcript_92011/g.286347  ORF Transcript_92011/g.286347 Transcript_92011/m.286347 type:complete len:476 (+) Transcript_92011:132-1559(+)
MATSSLANFEENNPRAVINSPRSLQACKQEGVLPHDLIYKPVENFQERNLSPRLVKLRYDFFEAKRRDLLAASRRARDAIVADEKREKESSNSQLQVLSRDSGLTRGAILAIQSDGLKLERQKLLRAQEQERNWLKNALNNELNQLKLLENGNEVLKKQADAEADKAAEKARIMKELNDRRAQEEERKQLEAEARQKLEKQLAKEEFHRQQQELAKKGEMEALKQKEAYERQLREMEQKKLAEMEKEKKREQAFKEQEARRAEMRAQDLRRQDVLEQQKEVFQVSMMEKKEMRDMRIYNSMQSNLELEQQRREAFEEKQRQDQIREERLMQAKALEQERSAKQAFQAMMRRKVIQEEAAKKQAEEEAAKKRAEEEAQKKVDEARKKAEEEAAAKAKAGGPIWTVVGGQDGKGILVRSGESTQSASLGRLATGATIKELQKKKNRLQYKMVEGGGPDSGWVTISADGKPLVALQQK